MNTNRQRQAVAGIRDPGFDGSGVARASPLLRRARSRLPGGALPADREARTTPFYLMVMAWLTLAASMAVADTHYVDISCKASRAPYTSWHTAANTIEDAVNAASAGDTVCVADGTYEISNPIEISKALTVRSENGSAVTIADARKRCRVFEINARSGPIRLDGFTVTGGYQNPDRPNAFGGGIEAQGTCETWISNCIIDGNVARRGGGIVIIAGGNVNSSAVVQNCLVRNNRAGWIGGGISIHMRGKSTGSITIRNCTIVENHGQYFGGIVNWSVDNPKQNIKIIDSIIARNSGGGALRLNLIKCILFKNGDPDADECDGDYLTTNPRFVDANHGNYRLAPGSPCIDRGSTRSAVPFVDLDGLPRILDGDRDGNAVVDIGAYEFQVLQVEIDIKPGYRNNSINLKVGGHVPVALHTTEFFDAVEVNPATVRFANVPPMLHMFRDVDGDGDADLLMEFSRNILQLGADSTHASLTGETRDGLLFIGTGEITVVNE